MNAAAEDAEAGRLVRVMFDAFDAKEFKDMKGFGEFWQRAIAPTINSVSQSSQRLVLEAKDSIKTKIEGDSK